MNFGYWSRLQIHGDASIKKFTAYRNKIKILEIVPVDIKILPMASVLWALNSKVDMNPHTSEPSLVETAHTESPACQNHYLGNKVCKG